MRPIVALERCDQIWASGRYHYQAADRCLHSRPSCLQILMERGVGKKGADGQFTWAHFIDRFPRHRPETVVRCASSFLSVAVTSLRKLLSPSVRYPSEVFLLYVLPHPQLWASVAAVPGHACKPGLYPGGRPKRGHPRQRQALHHPRAHWPLASHPCQGSVTPYPAPHLSRVGYQLSLNDVRATHTPHTLSRTYIRTKTHTRIHPSTHTHTYADRHTNTNIHTHTHTLSKLHVHTSAQTRTHTHTPNYAHISHS
jgi:hypothetical protein